MGKLIFELSDDERASLERIRIARALPAGWSVPERMAAATLRLDRWSAGEQLLRKSDPGRWNLFAEGAELERQNHDRLEACRREVVKQPARCSVFVGR